MLIFLQFLLSGTIPKVFISRDVRIIEVLLYKKYRTEIDICFIHKKLENIRKFKI